MMKFRNYCLVILGEIDGVKDEILKISETSNYKPHYLDAKGILLCTFTSALTPKEIKEYFKSNNRSILVFELDDENSGVHIEDDRLHSHIFGYMEKSKSELEIMTNKMMSNIRKTSGDTETNIVESSENIDVGELSKEEKDKIINNLLDKGQENWSDEDRKIMRLLSDE